MTLLSTPQTDKFVRKSGGLPAPVGSFADVPYRLASVLADHGLRPSEAAISELVDAHRHALVHRLLLEHGIVDHAPRALVEHLRSVDDARTLAIIMRHHATVLEALVDEVRSKS